MKVPEFYRNMGFNKHTFDQLLKMLAADNPTKRGKSSNNKKSK